MTLKQIVIAAKILIVTGAAGMAVFLLMIPIACIADLPNPMLWVYVPMAVSAACTTGYLGLVFFAVPHRKRPANECAKRKRKENREEQ
ncbi:MAG: hypothetical protein II117_07510 [Clostridia bacterium]|nr:hypothetical protein [Clostridia bacterium]